MQESQSVRAGRKISRNQRRAARTRSARIRGGASILGGARLRPPPASTVNSPESARAIAWLFLGKRRQQRPALGLSYAETLRSAPAHFWGHACEAAWSSEGESRDAVFVGGEGETAQPRLSWHLSPAVTGLTGSSAPRFESGGAGRESDSRLK